MFWDAVKYTLFPRVMPRINNLVFSGFANLAGIIALTYRGVKLLPENHPYLNPQMRGQFGILDVVREAANNIHFSLKNIDQIILFFAMIAGLVILTIQFVLLLLAIVVQSAEASISPSNYSEFFILDGRENDLALTMLDKVFGVPNMFGTSVEIGTPFHLALHQLLQFYSIGLLVIAAIVIAYFIFAIIVETAQTGTPFGKRYNHAWAPIRLVVAIGLLVPIGSGLNAAQWVTLYSAKYGSGFATSGWVKFNETLNNTYIESDALVATPNVPGLKDLTALMTIVHACQLGYIKENSDIGDEIKAWIVDPTSANDPVEIEGITTPWAASYNSGSGSDNWIRNYDRIHIRFGEANPKHTESSGNVHPYCGELVFTNPLPGDNTSVGENGQTRIEPSQVMLWRYFVLVQKMWDKGDSDFGMPLCQTAYNLTLPHLRHSTAGEEYCSGGGSSSSNGNEATIVDKGIIVQRAETFINRGVEGTVDRLKENFTPTNIEQIRDRGWGGAGIWYNQVANVNGGLVSAVLNKPSVKAYPKVMMYTCDKNRQQNKETSSGQCFDPRLEGGKSVPYISEVSQAMATALNDVYSYWYEDISTNSGNAFIDTINAVLGTQGLFDMCRNADIHPLAQVSTAGKGMVEAAIRNLGIGIGVGIGSGASSILAPFLGPTLSAASGFFVTVASIGILIGFILYYVVPFMPFLYFLFAVGGWVKGLFEAMVGVPLWALAHIRIDGQGLPGDSAINGYFLIFEIFIRPILIVFGLLASVIIFAAMIKVMNETFSLVVSNLSGFSSANESQCGTAFDSASGAPTGSIDYLRGPVDEFFFTIVYAILVYMIGMASFKLIDMIPNQILRWMGAGVSTFNDNAGEPAEGLISKLAIGGGIMGGQLQQAGSAAGQAGGNLAGAAKNLVTGGPPKQ